MKITGSKKGPFFNIILMATVISVASLAFLYLRSGKSEVEDLPMDKVFKAVPSDASSIFYFSSFQSLNRNLSTDRSLFGTFFFGEGALKLFIDRLYSLSGEASLVDFKKLESLISSHYSSKNRISSLLAIEMNSVDLSFIEKELSKNSKKRNYNNIKIYSWSKVDFAFCKDFLIASPSSIILESSIRHLQSGSSILESDGFREVLSSSFSSDIVAFVNHSQIGKLFSGFADRSYLKYADFISKLTSWSAFYFSNSTKTVEAEGDFLNKKGWGNFLTIFNDSKGGGSRIASVVPSNTYALLTISIKDISRFITSFSRYKEYYKKGDRKQESDALKWFESLNAEEVSNALIPYGGKLEKVTIIKSNYKRGNFLKRLFSKDNEEINPQEFAQKGFMAHLFGDYFRQSEEAVLYKDNWIFIGPQKLLEEFAKESYTSFSMEGFLSQTKARNLLGNKKTLLSVIVNGTAAPDSLLEMFKKEVRDKSKNIIKDNNLIITAFQLQTKEDGAIGSRFFAYADSLKKLPEASGVNTDKMPGWESDTIVNVPSGPFQLINFDSGEKEYLEQLPSLWIRLSDKNRKGLWAIPFSSPLCGHVEQVDYFRNGNLQMLFASEKKIYLLDRRGRFVYPFPKSVDSLILLGPKTYDLKSDGDYAIMLLHADNTLRLYDRMALPYPAWKDITLEETIKDFPELIEVGANKYWVLRTGVRTVIYTINGNPVTTFSDKNRLKPDSPVLPAGDSYVKVRSVQERDILLDLETGKTRRLK